MSAIFRTFMASLVTPLQIAFPPKWRQNVQPHNESDEGSQARGTVFVGELPYKKAYAILFTGELIHGVDSGAVLEWLRLAAV